MVVKWNFATYEATAKRNSGESESEVGIGRVQLRTATQLSICSLFAASSILTSSIFTACISHQILVGILLTHPTVNAPLVTSRDPVDNNVALP